MGGGGGGEGGEAFLPHLRVIFEPAQGALSDMVADPRHFNADPIRVWILLLIKMMRICDHWPTDPSGLRFEPPAPPLLASVALHGPF